MKCGFTGPEICIKEKPPSYSNIAALVEGAGATDLELSLERVLYVTDLKCFTF